MSAVLLTGAGGFLGGHVLQQLVDKTSHDVICVDSFRHNGRFATITNALDLRYSDRVRIVTHDLAAPFSPVDINDLGNVEIILNLASGASVDESLKNPGRFIRDNVELMVNVLDLARTLDVRQFVHMSTDEVYGTSARLQHRPSSPYSASKAAQEDISHAYMSSFNVPVTHVVSCNMFGERQSTLAFIPKLIRQLLAGETVQIHTDRWGAPGRRFYNYVGNVASYIVDLIEDDTALLRHKHYLNGQINLNNSTLAGYVAGFLGLKDKFKFECVPGISSRPGYDASYEGLPDADHWVPKITFMQALEQTVRWFEKNQEWLG